MTDPRKLDVGDFILLHTRMSEFMIEHREDGLYISGGEDGIEPVPCEYDGQTYSCFPYGYDPEVAAQRREFEKQGGKK